MGQNLTIRYTHILEWQSHLLKDFSRRSVESFDPPNLPLKLTCGPQSLCFHVQDTRRGSSPNWSHGFWSSESLPPWRRYFDEPGSHTRWLLPPVSQNSSKWFQDFETSSLAFLFCFISYQWHFQCSNKIATPRETWTLSKPWSLWRRGHCQAYF